MLKEETIMLGCAIVITGAAVVMISNANTVKEETELLSSKIHGLNSDVRLATEHLVQLRAETKEGNRMLSSLLDAEIKKKAALDSMSGAQPKKVNNAPTSTPTQKNKSTKKDDSLAHELERTRTITRDLEEEEERKRQREMDRFSSRER